MKNIKTKNVIGEIARRSLLKFIAFVKPNTSITQFHQKYYEILSDFAHHKITNLIISIPPQHGKSYAASELLPAYLLGINPNLRICIGSYSFSLARRFGLAVQRIIESPQYQQLFPNVKLKKQGNTAQMALRTADEFDILDHAGGLRLVGREGALTGSRIDVIILDDLYKDAAEGNSPLIREKVWLWYCAVVKTRLSNNSQEIIVFTRWHQDDLIGRLLKSEPQKWTLLNFPALKITPPSEPDPRQIGEALWPERHSRESLLDRQKLDPSLFESLYQGNPTPKEGLLYPDFTTYLEIEEPTTHRAAYIDTADTGADLLCAIFYSVGLSQKIYVTHIIYTDQPMEITEKLVANELLNQNTDFVYVESNNGGRGFARAIARTVRCKIIPFHQSANKTSRIISNATAVVRTIVMPQNWSTLFPLFHMHVTSFRQQIAANAHDDAPDALTGIIEKELPKTKITAIAFN